jgi:signal recognition particle subunit SRP19
VRKQQKTILWPSYFDSSRTRKGGRKVPKSFGVPNPSIAELQGAAERLGMKPEIEVDATHPSSHWRKTGRILVQKKGTKAHIVTNIAREIATMRQKTKK